ncbi:hypothetical protein [Legionella cincinnatiensis]|uniref:Uncharacterized protein n=1 Tax=Legionella cincinnatiensis TaxID=28085 RepID=A0A378ILX7_9GAMM|nr:hypothetical protein [Legionella cincinnatiensis]KTC83415.1 hypothetical protein Lcin_2102 [Legionella cincinnatiensis]STX35501.1 Uncharacterised protein [Legionella cincinnatiensis]
MQTKLHLEIVNNLKTLKINEDCIQRIMDAVDKMPGKEHVKGALKFLTEITSQKSRRESYYQYSHYFAEYFCTISNLGLFAVAYYYGDYATLAAATFSALSHAIPLQRLHDLDLLGVFIIFGKAISQYKIIMERPEVLAWGTAALGVNIMDTLITRKHLDKIGPAIHVVWHLAAAFALYKFNQAQVEIAENELQNVLEAIPTHQIPGFLQSSYEVISDYIYNFSIQTNCVLQ